MKRIVTLLMVALVVSLSPICAEVNSGNDAPVATLTAEEESILNLCHWVVDTPLSDQGVEQARRKEASAEILRYAADTDRFSINLGKAAVNLLDLSKGSKESADLLMVYLAGEIIYCLDHNLTESNAASFASAINGVVNIYSQLPKHSIKPLNKYLKMDAEKRIAALENYYKKEN